MLIRIQKINESISFPQANDIYKVLKFIDLRTNNYYQKEFDKIDLKMVSRQSSYYKSAAKYLGLFDKSEPTELAQHLFKLDKDILFINVVQLILQNEVFYKHYINRDLDQTINYLKSRYNMNLSTATRRASTVINWVKWCDAIIKENNITIEEEVKWT